MNLHVLIMAGGNGTRFWPVSTPERPKQYTKLSGDKSLLQESINRSLKFTGPENCYVVTTRSQRELALEQTNELIPEENIIIEPEGRNTAPCIFLSLLHLLKKGVSDEDCIVVLPSDHVINNHSNFKNDIVSAANNSSKNSSITVIGIQPTFAHTGYGYIQQGEKLSEGIFKANKFVEKPEQSLADKYFSSKEYFWNAGMFIAPLGTLLSEIKSLCPDLGNFQNALSEAIGDENKTGDVYSSLPKDSIDYAVIEKSNRVEVVQSTFDWSDLGSWDALEDVIEKKEENVQASLAGAQCLNSQGNIIYAPGKKVSLINCQDLVVVSEGDHIMVLPKKDAQLVKQLNQTI